MERRSPPVILLVDDNDRVRAHYAEALQRADFDVVEVGAWQAARDAVNTTRPRIVVASFAPDARESCLTFCREIKTDQRTQDIPILVVARDITREDLRLAMDAGVLMVTLYQGDPTKLVAAVNGMLAAQRTEASPGLRQQTGLSRSA